MNLIKSIPWFLNENTQSIKTIPVTDYSLKTCYKYLCKWEELALIWILKWFKYSSEFDCGPCYPCFFLSYISLARMRLIFIVIQMIFNYIFIYRLGMSAPLRIPLIALTTLICTSWDFSASPLDSSIPLSTFQILIKHPDKPWPRLVQYFIFWTFADGLWIATKKHLPYPILDLDAKAFLSTAHGWELVIVCEIHLSTESYIIYWLCKLPNL